MPEFVSLYILMGLVTAKRLHVNSLTFAGLQLEGENLVSFTQVLADLESLYCSRYLRSHVVDWFMDSVQLLF